MTNRDFFKAIIDSNVEEGLKDFARESLDKIDARNKARSSKPSKTSLENAPIKAKIYDFLCNRPDEWILADEIGTKCEISTNKASTLCRQLVEENMLISNDVKVKGKGVRKGYKTFSD